MKTIQTRTFLVVSTSSALWLLAAALALGQSGQQFPYVLQYELGDGEFASGDSITIQSLQGTTDPIQPGGTYCVTGTYTLESQEEADLSFFATTTDKTPAPIDPEQTMRVKKGTGSFRLVKKMAGDGYLHLTFYSRKTGRGFGGVYFGQGQWVLRNKQFSFAKAASGREETPSAEQLSNSGPNQVLFNYLGNPVEPPSKMDAAYSKEGLIRAMEAAAQNAGISLVKVEIDDSEFPFLIGVVFAKSGDKEKLKEQIVKSGTYSSTGGVGGEIDYVMNIIPYNVFPRESSQRAHRRMMLRESILYDKMTGTR